MPCTLTLILSLTVIFCLSITSDCITTVTVAGVLSSKDIEVFFQDAVDKLNESPLMKPHLQFNATTIIMDPNPIRSALAVCDSLLLNHVSAVIVSHPPPSPDAPPYIDVPHVSHLSPVSDLTTSPVSYTCGYYGLPVVGITSRHIALSDKHIHPTFVRTVAPYFHQADVWIDILRYFGWDRIVFIHSQDEEGFAIYKRFLPLLKGSTIKMEQLVLFTPGLLNYTDDLNVITQLQARIILLYASSEHDAQNLFESAHELGLCGKGYGWIVNEQVLNANSIPIGTLGIRLVNGTNERAHVLDSLTLLAQAFIKVAELHNITTPTDDCNVSDTKWDDGFLVYRALLSECIEKGATGHVCLDPQGDRMYPVYEVINIHSDGLVVSGIYGTSRARKLPIYIIEPRLVFPGNTSDRPTSVEINHHLKILTIGDPPFLSTTKMSDDSVCSGQTGDSVVVCYHINQTTGVRSRYCCMGYNMDLISIIANFCNFTFDVTLSFDGYVGSSKYVTINGTSTQKWDGLIGQLDQQKFDVIATPMTINVEHAAAIAFSKPFKFQGLTILAKKTAKESSLGSFLQPFDKTLWFLIMTAVHVVALSLYLLDRFSPFGRYKLMKSDDTEDDALNFSSAIWFTWSVLMNSGVGEGTPRSFSARVLGMVWAGFGMILIASYTANLAAFLVLDNRPEASISGIDDSRLRNPQENFRFATIKNSAVNMFFKKKTEYSEMFEELQKYNYGDVSDAINDVKEGVLQAFIWDHARLEYEAALDCHLMTLGDMFGSWQYGFGIRKHLYWIKPINDAIKMLGEEYVLDELNSKWLIERRQPRAICNLVNQVPATLGITNMAGVFMMVGVGILAGIALLLVEIIYKRHNRLRDKELELARNAADRWKTTVVKRRAMRRALDGESYETIHRNSMCESLLRGVASARSTLSSLPNADIQPSFIDNSAMLQSTANSAILQAQAVAVFDNIL